MSGAPGLPRVVRACLFDLDGVLTPTATIHFAAWKRMFDPFLADHGEGDAARPFTQADYNAHVDGRPREDGVRGLLADRGIEIPAGSPDDPADADTVHGLGRRKNDRVQQVIAEDGVEAYPGSVAYLRAVREAGVATAVVSASANCRQVVHAAGLDPYLDHRVDGETAARDRLRGKPAPDTFLAAARELGVRPDEAAVFEDAVAGVRAGVAGEFAVVVGVDRVDHGGALREAGATLVVTDLDELLDGHGA